MGVMGQNILLYFYCMEKYQGVRTFDIIPKPYLSTSLRSDLIFLEMYIFLGTFIKTGCKGEVKDTSETFKLIS